VNHESGFVNVPVSIGELYDKITILQIKLDKLPSKSEVIRKELDLLMSIETTLGGGFLNHKLVQQLREVNAELWEIEEGKRAHEKISDFGESFIALARAVYIKNDFRASIKREINQLSGSPLQEVKSHDSVAGN
jgi:hypothetical protein